LLGYFGEEFEADNCGGCDSCLSPREKFDGTLAAQKLLSCVYRIREKNEFGVGLNHVVEVLTGADTEKIRRWSHERLSTYGIGREHGRAEWAEIGRELIRLGLLRQTADKFSVVELTDAGLQALTRREKVTLTKPVARTEPAANRAGQVSCDEVLFDRLRQLRKRLADERNVPAYIVFSDLALRQMARDYPANEREFARISGVGEKKLHEFGSVFLAEIAAHLQANPRQVFAEASFQSTPAAKAYLTDTIRATLQAFRDGKTVEEIATQRKLTPGTIFGHLNSAAEAGERIELGRLLTVEQQREIEEVFTQTGFGNLTRAKELLGERFEYGQLRIYRAVRNATSASREAV
jgi:ATP-dependent DNA helicase RecQ